VTELTRTGLRSPEAARRLGIDGADVYRLLFAGDLDGGPGRDGLVYVSEASVEKYLERHGFGNVSNNLSNEPRRTGPDDGERASVDKAADQHQRGRRRTKPDGRGPRQSGS
jgi:hypothetical protein